MKTILKKVITDNPEETQRIGELFGKTLKGGETILMFGEAGAGKTVFTKGVAKSLGITERVTSPTFALKNEYYGRLKLYHLDMYRIEDETEIIETGALDDIYGENVVAIVEWAENVLEFFNFPHIEIHIKYLGEHKREIKIEKHE